MRRLLIALTLVVGTSASSTLNAQMFFCTDAAIGSSQDVSVRMTVAKLQERLGSSIVVLNGASCPRNKGIRFFASATTTPPGYTGIYQGRFPTFPNTSFSGSWIVSSAPDVPANVVEAVRSGIADSGRGSDASGAMRSANSRGAGSAAARTQIPVPNDCIEWISAIFLERPSTVDDAQIILELHPSRGQATRWWAVDGSANIQSSISAYCSHVRTGPTWQDLVRTGFDALMRGLGEHLKSGGYIDLNRRPPPSQAVGARG